MRPVKKAADFNEWGSGMNIAIDGPAGAGKSTIARLVSKKLDFIYVEQYKIDCENCSDKRENRKYIFTADIALYNVNESIKFAVLKFADLENSIRDVLKQKYKVVEIEFKNTSVNKRYAGSKDVRDTIIVKFSN